MLTSLSSAATGMEAQQSRIDIIANNLANVNTTGFKRSRAYFQDLLYESRRTVGSASTGSTDVPTGIQVGLGVRTAAVERLHTMGSLEKTGNELDLALQGDGFFQVELPNGNIAYTRDGSFQKDSQGRLVTADGYPVSPGITLPENTTEIAIGEDGTVQVFQDNETEGTEVGVIEIARFGNPAGLKSLGGNLYQETVTSGDPMLGTPGEEGLGQILQGYLEGSNVNVMNQMVNLISSQRAYEVNSKAIKTSDEMLQMVNQLA
jgi:flagellar basal-body rod protein FlgG